MPGGNIFLNYRRDDTAGHAGRLFDRLNARFPGCIFRDVTGIALGRDFVEEIERKLDQCHVLIVVIGKLWLTLQNEEGDRRIDDPHDFVRLEVATGLRRNIRVIPVLVAGARMPRSSELPDDLKPLAQRNALEITEPDFDSDVARLIRELERMFGEERPAPGPSFPTYPPAPRWPLWKTAGLVTVLGGTALFLLLLALGAMPGPQPVANKRINPSPNYGAQSVTTGPAPAPTGRQANTSPVRNANPAADPKATGATTTPLPHRASSEVNAPPESPDEEFFNPVGVWTVTGVGTDLRASAIFRDDNSYYGEGVFQKTFGRSSGMWAYNPQERVLSVQGQNDAGYVFNVWMKIVERHQNTYRVYHSFYGDILMERAPSN